MGSLEVELGGRKIAVQAARNFRAGVIVKRRLMRGNLALPVWAGSVPFQPAPRSCATMRGLSARPCRLPVSESSFKPRARRSSRSLSDRGNYTTTAISILSPGTLGCAWSRVDRLATWCSIPPVQARGRVRLAKFGELAVEERFQGWLLFGYHRSGDSSGDVVEGGLRVVEGVGLNVAEGGDVLIEERLAVRAGVLRARRRRSPEGSRSPI